MSLAWHTRKSITVDLLERLVFDELNEASAAEFFARLSNDAPANYAAKSASLWRSEKRFSLPQPGLKRARLDFEISETPHVVKSLSPAFSKRVLLQKRVIGSTTFPTSVPFGYRSSSQQAEYFC